MIGCIVIVARNNLALTKRAVRSAQAQDVDCPVVVVDNASDDGTARWLHAQRIPTITYLYQVSLSRCWNESVSLNGHGDMSCTLICNNDIEIRSDTFRLLQGCYRPFITCVSVSDIARIGVPGDRNVPTLLEGARPHPDFSCFMIRSDVINQVGLFDESFYPAYCEDCDYHVRMHRAGITALCVDLPFYHRGAQTLATANSREANKIRRGADRCRSLFQKKYGCMPGTSEYRRLFEPRQVSAAEG